MGYTNFDQVSVTSGYYVGAHDAERQIIGATGSLGSGTVDRNAIQGGMRIDKGMTGVSGGVIISTALTSIAAATASLMHCVSGLVGIKTVFSGGNTGSFAINTYTDLGAASALSTPVSWIVVGT